MIAKIHKTQSFASTVNYLLSKEDARLLRAQELRAYSKEAMIRDLNFQAGMRYEIAKPVGHIVLSWSKEDRNKLNGKLMVDCAKSYMESMGIRNTQWLMVQHRDTDHPHLHLLFNRISNDGEILLSGKDDSWTSISVINKLDKEYGFSTGSQRHQVNREALRGVDKCKYQVYDALQLHMQEVSSWDELQARLALQGIKTYFRKNKQSDEPVGVVFESEKIKIKGSAVARNYSYQGISRLLKENKKLARRKMKKEKKKQQRLNAGYAHKPEAHYEESFQKPRMPRNGLKF